MNLHGIIFPAFNGYDGVAYEIYVQGCNRQCKGCHSPETWDFEGGKEIDFSALIKDMNKKSKWFDIISILGGDFLCQDEEEAIATALIFFFEFPNKKLWLFTGAEKEDIPLWCYRIFDVIKCGSFKEELKTEGFPSSSNQMMLKKGVDY